MSIAIQCPALVLNADFQPLSYFPLSLISWRDAVKSVFQGTHTVVAQYEAIARSPSIEMRLPSVLALRSYVPRPRRAAFTRFNVFLRDRFRCQYCGERHAPGELTFDHVVPRSRGGRTTWTNVVAACEPCNTAKDNKLTRPITMPREPTPGDLLAAQRAFPPNYLHESWADYLYWDSELEK
jgi:5-methylcytosine-specific restriction endonuclease McrA